MLQEVRVAIIPHAPDSVDQHPLLVVLVVDGVVGVEHALVRVRARARVDGGSNAGRDRSCSMFAFIQPHDRVDGGSAFDGVEHTLLLEPALERLAPFGHRQLGLHRIRL